MHNDVLVLSSIITFRAAGTISNKEARDALRLHKGNVWSAVTECVEQRRKKVRSESKHRRRVFPFIGLTVIADPNPHNEVQLTKISAGKIKLIVHGFGLSVISRSSPLNILVSSGTCYASLANI